MLALFILISVASAEYLIKEVNAGGQRTATVIKLNQCYNYKENNADVSMKITYEKKANDTSKKVYGNKYTGKDCTSTPESKESTEYAEMTYVTELPVRGIPNIVYVVTQNPNKGMDNAHGTEKLIKWEIYHHFQNG